MINWGIRIVDVFTKSDIFSTYNPNIAKEQTLAVRLHAVGATSGFRMYLPERYNSETILDNCDKIVHRIG